MSDYLELTLAAVLFSFFLLHRRIEPVFKSLADRAAWCMLLLAVLPIALRLALLPHHPIPTPELYDEFSHLLVADTLRHLRLANPTHPFHQFFETFFVLQEPSYSSIYPVGQGLALAMGRAIFGHPWAGVVLSVAAFCSASYWMLRAWTTPAWALVGGLLAVFEFGPLNQWMNSYWGGGVAAMAGCLVFGALPRIQQRGRVRDAVLLGLGLGITVITRPYESTFLFLSVIAFVASGARTAGTIPLWGKLPWRTHSCVQCRHSWRHLRFQKQPGVGKSADTASTSACATTRRHLRFQRQPGVGKSAGTASTSACATTRRHLGVQLQPGVGKSAATARTSACATTARSHAKLAGIAALALLPAIALTLLQNKQVTGRWTTLPAMASQYQYGVPTTFTLQANPIPHRALTRQQELSYRSQVSYHGAGTDTVTSYLRRLEYRVRFYRFFFLAPFYLALPAFLLKLREFRFQWVIATLFLCILGSNFYPFFFPHHTAALTCLFLLITVIGLERWGRKVGPIILLIAVLQFVFWYGFHLIEGSDSPPSLLRYETWNSIDHDATNRRTLVRDRLTSAPGKQLVFVRYQPQHIFQDEWVYNEADIDAARVVWARDLGPQENQKLQQYYPDRTVWLLEPDARPPLLNPYLPPPAAEPPKPVEPEKPTAKPSKPVLKFEEVPEAR